MFSAQYLHPTADRRENKVNWANSRIVSFPQRELAADPVFRKRKKGREPGKPLFPESNRESIPGGDRRSSGEALKQDQHQSVRMKKPGGAGSCHRVGWICPAQQAGAGKRRKLTGSVDRTSRDHPSVQPGNARPGSPTSRRRLPVPCSSRRGGGKVRSCGLRCRPAEP